MHICVLWKFNKLTHVRLELCLEHSDFSQSSWCLSLELASKLCFRVDRKFRDPLLTPAFFKEKCISNDKGHGFSLDQQILPFKRALHTILTWVTDNVYKKLKLIETKQPTKTECLMVSGAGDGTDVTSTRDPSCNQSPLPFWIFSHYFSLVTYFWAKLLVLAFTSPRPFPLSHFFSSTTILRAHKPVPMTTLPEGLSSSQNIWVRRPLCHLLAHRSDL